ncbi:MAG TPA: Uma2 family endonuclease [Humisphaera sp.]
MVAATPDTLVPFASAQHLVLEGVSWDFYERVLAEIGNGAVRVAFDGGKIEIMSPLPEHELIKKPLARLVELMALERAVELVGLGATTFRDAIAEKGLEPDECYYVQHADAVRDIKGEYDPAVHTPPDLAIEVEVTRKSLPREPIYAALRVPELWVASERGIRCRHLQPGGQYADADRSLAFPFIAPADLWPWVVRLKGGEKSVAVLREFQAWVRQIG